MNHSFLFISHLEEQNNSLLLLFNLSWDRNLSCICDLYVSVDLILLTFLTLQLLLDIHLC